MKMGRNKTPMMGSHVAPLLPSWLVCGV